MVSIARGAVAAGMGDDRKIHLFYGCRETADLCQPSVLGEDVEPYVSFTSALSKPESSSVWDGATGLLHDVVETEMGESLTECTIYFAGPPVMSAAIQKMAHPEYPLDSGLRTVWAPTSRSYPGTWQSAAMRCQPVSSFDTPDRSAEQSGTARHSMINLSFRSTQQPIPTSWSTVRASFSFEAAR